MSDTNTVIEGTVKFRDGKKWKSRWCVMRKLSPVADCLHLQLYRDSKDRYKQGQTKASLSLQHFLGVETGFTLDKESNTIAILCKDVTVVLAFDTRERLIQWQVKIASNLGEDTQFLVQISSAPQKAKIAAGPARLHIQEYRFCITLGVPPRLVGVWEISKLRRYGVVESRFCFEGGSRCGKGEGLYVLVTDQGEEITRTLQAASDGKMASRRRPLQRNISVLDSPRKMRPETRLSQLSRADTLSLQHGADTMSCAESISTVHQQHCCCGCRSSTDDLSTIWPSSETRPDSSDFGDTASVGDISHSMHHTLNDCGDWSESGMGRCASCISKLGALSRSSTATTAATPGAHHPFSPPWYLDPAASGPRSLQTGSTTCSTISASCHDNSTYNLPDYSSLKSIASDTWSMKNGSGSEKCPCCPPGRPPKESACRKLRKPPMPLPPEQANTFENYDVPRSFITPLKEEKNGGDEYYDTPKSMKEVLDQEYGNYDTPPAGLRPACLCTPRPHPPALHHCTRVVLDNEEMKSRACPCHRVMCWPSNWLSLPYCRRGNSIEHTSVHLHKVKLNGEGKMPVVNSTGDVAVYATVDISKKVKYRLRMEDCKEENKENNPAENRLADTSGEHRPASNYVNLDVTEQPPCDSKEGIVNYENLEFAHSLEYYENARDVLNRSGIVPNENNRTECRDRLELSSAEKDCVKFCNKCGHSCSRNDLSKRGDPKQDDYLMMGPGGAEEGGHCTSRYPGYLPMHPSGRDGSKGPPCHLGPERASSIPSLASLERCKKQDLDSRLPLAGNVCASANSSPYLRRHPMVSLKELQKNQREHFRKRSCSADSSRFPDEEDKLSHANESSKNTSIDSIISQTCIQLQEKCETVQEQLHEALVHVRRSSSVPSKSGNRDSSSSNDSGVSTESFKNRSDFTDFELPLTTAKSTKRHYHAITQRFHGSNDCIHASLPRRSKSSDPLRDLTFQFPKIKVSTKSSSAEAEIPICLNKHESKDYTSPNGDGALVVPYTDSRSTSSGTSDMSDYIETLSVSSHSSSDTPDSIRLGRIAVTTLRPRSGKEYHKIDRFILDGDIKGKNIISTVPEKSESPSPGYVSGSPGN